MKHLSLDLGYNLGFTVWENDTPTYSGVKTFDKRKQQGRIFFEFQRFLVDELKLPFIEYVSIESIRPRGMIRAEWLEQWYGMRSILVLRAYQCNVLVGDKGIVPTSVKKAFTGSGKADKKQMLREANLRYGEYLGLIKDDNQADSLAIGYYAWEHSLKLLAANDLKPLNIR